MLGSMIAVTLAAILRAPIVPPVGLRKIMVPILGVMLGSGFRPETFEHVGEWGLTLVVLPFFVAAAFGGAFLFYRKIGGYDPVTAFYASAPGGLNEMLILGAEAGGDERRIAMAHASRILIVVSFVVFFYALFLDISSTGPARPYVGFDDVPLRDLAILAGCAVLGALVGPMIRLPAAQVLGPMLLSAAAHLTGLTGAPPPTLAVNAAQLVIGTVVGSRFLGAAPRAVLRDMALAVGSCAAMITVALISAIVVTQFTGIGLEQTFLAFSPGGLPEMSLLALAMNADIAYVATLHIARISLVIAVAPLIFRVLGVLPR